MTPPPTLRAVLFDVDGTLYRQRPLRLAMAMELLGLFGAASPSRAVRTCRIVRLYRQVHEELRATGVSDGSLADRQILETASRMGLDVSEVDAVVAEWMYRRPLKYLRWCRRRDLVPLLERLTQSGVRLGVLSDYPAHDKLAALGVADYFSLVVCTTSPDVNALKPHPRGFRRVCELWNLQPEEILFVGDRLDVDAPGALAAGLRCAILGRRSSGGAIPHLGRVAEAVGC